MIDARRGRQALACLTAFATLLLIAGFASDASGATAPPLAQFNRETYAYSTTLTTSQEANRYQVMVLQATDHAQVPLLKAANPNLKILMYSDILATNASDPPAWAECTVYSTDNAQHPTWFLLNQKGQRIASTSYPGQYVMDVGNTAYQQACVAHPLSLAKQYGFDGIYFDGATADLAYALPAGMTSPKYPNRTAWQAAVYSMLSYAAPQIHAQHLLLVGNIGGGATQAGLWQKWTGVMDGSEEESWLDSNVSYFWPQMLADTAWSEANGKIAILHSHYTTEPGNAFALAEMMLVAGGKSSYSTSNGNYQGAELWFPEYTQAQSLGAATSGMTQLPNGVSARAFANGVVLANTSGSSKTVSLLGGTYSGSQLSKVTSASMATASGLILLKDVPNTSQAPFNVVAPAITGSLAPGQTVTANTGLWSSVPTATYTYQWKRCLTTALKTCSVISGVTGATYQVQSADSSHYLSVTVTARNSAGSRIGYSPLSAQVS